jgi:hypothetical protein
MLPEQQEHADIKELILENQRLVAENNVLLKKIHKATVWSFWLRLVWVLILIGVPFVLYYFVIEPYFTTLGSSFDTFRAGLQEVPGWKQFYDSIGGTE